MEGGELIRLGEESVRDPQPLGSGEASVTNENLVVADDAERAGAQPTKPGQRVITARIPATRVPPPTEQAAGGLSASVSPTDIATEDDPAAVAPRGAKAQVHPHDAAIGPDWLDDGSGPTLVVPHTVAALPVEVATYYLEAGFNPRDAYVDDDDFRELEDEIDRALMARYSAPAFVVDGDYASEVEDVLELGEGPIDGAGVDDTELSALLGDPSIAALRSEDMEAIGFELRLALDPPVSPIGEPAPPIAIEAAAAEAAPPGNGETARQPSAPGAPTGTSPTSLPSTAGTSVAPQPAAEPAVATASGVPGTPTAAGLAVPALHQQHQLHQQLYSTTGDITPIVQP